MKDYSIISRKLSLIVVAVTFTFPFICGCNRLEEGESNESATDISGKYVLTLSVTSDITTKTSITQDNTILPVDWKSGDKLYVSGETDGYIGYLDIDSGAGSENATFTGTLSSAWVTSNQKLHIYYLGSSTPAISDEDKFTFDISTQLGTLAGIESSGHISHTVTSELNPGSQTISASLTMSNMNAVVLYDLSNWTDGVKISGTFNKAVLNLKTGLFDTTDCSGDITLESSACSSTAYVTFIPNNAALTFSKGMYTTPVRANDVKAGRFYSNEGNAIEVPRLDSGASLPGEFTVDAYGTKVCFSKGNLQATKSETGAITANGDDNSKWNFGFAEHQYDYIGDSNITSENKLGNVIDWFCWSSNEDGKYLYGISTIWDNSYYGTSTDASTFNDWGNISTLPGNGESEKIWYTLSLTQWYYLLYTRTVNGGTLESHSYQRTTLTLNDNSTVYGLIIAPDNFSGTLSGTTSWSEWQTLENKGCVFLPAAGYRDGTTIYNVNQSGTYFSGTPYNDQSAYAMGFYAGGVGPANECYRAHGCSVRLVCDAE